MKSFVVLVAVLVGSTTLAQTAEQRAKIDKLMPRLRALAADPVIVKAVREQNAKKVPIATIKKLDTDWIASSGVTDDVRAYLENVCAQRLKKAKTEFATISEAFAMDNQGALVGTAAKTSDYWQGDEDKWQKSFAQGKGGELIDKPSFDESSQSFQVQVSLPVLEGGQAIGAITVGLALDRL